MEGEEEEEGGGNNPKINQLSHWDTFPCFPGLNRLLIGFQARTCAFLETNHLPPESLALFSIRHSFRWRSRVLSG